VRRPLVLVTTFCALVLVVLSGALAPPAAADGRFHRVPAAKRADRSPLQLRVVRYDGGTNGELTVEVENPGGKALMFEATGLYFVPDGDADQAPQRLGAVGPMQLVASGDGERARKDRVLVPAHGSVQVVLDVFCIDSHRSSPTSETPFTLASTRMPKQLAAGIERASAHAAVTVGGYAAPAAKASIQDVVWTTRDAKWVELAGEGTQEAAK
jgi:hypothetical protein